MAATVDKLVRALAPVEIWLFGSRARGTHRPDSDYDLLVVLPDEKIGNDFDAAYAPLIGSGVGVDVVPYGAKRFAEAVRDASTMAHIAIREGIRLYG